MELYTTRDGSLWYLLHSLEVPHEGKVIFRRVSQRHRSATNHVLGVRESRPLRTATAAKPGLFQASIAWQGGPQRKEEASNLASQQAKSRGQATDEPRVRREVSASGPHIMVTVNTSRVRHPYLLRCGSRRPGDHIDWRTMQGPVRTCGQVTKQDQRGNRYRPA